MNSEKNVNDLLSIDLDSVSKAAKQKSRKAKKKIIILFGCLGLLLIVGVTSFFIKQKKAETVYDKALVAIENEDYKLAMDLLKQTGNFKDSQKKLSDVELAYDFLNSETYTLEKEVVVGLFSAYNLSAGEDITSNISLNYDLENHSLIFSYDMALLSREDLTMANAWSIVHEMLNSYCKQSRESFLDAGFDVSYIILEYDKIGENLIFKSVNGETEFDYFNG